MPRPLAGATPLTEPRPITTMGAMTERIIIVVLLALMVVGFIWFRDDQRAQLGPCVALEGTDQDIPIYYRQGDGAFRAYSSPDCSAQSRITI